MAKKKKAITESDIFEDELDGNELNIDEAKDASFGPIDKEDPFVDEEIPSIEQISPARTKYKIDGLSPENEKQALEMLDSGAPIEDVCEYFGIARSDITAINFKK